MRYEIDLDAAAEAGLIGEDQAIALRNFQAQRDGITGASSEKFQIFGGYADLVIAIGLAMVLIAVAILVSMAFDARSVPAALLALALCSGATFAVWRGAHRVNLRASPATALVLTLAYAGFSFFGLLSLLVAIIGTMARAIDFEEIVLGGSLAVHAVMMRFHWRAFRFPPTPALVLAGYSYIALAIVTGLMWPGDPGPATAGTALLISIATMIAGVWWDMTDIRRETERSQVAFWLHCLAGVLMSRALFSLLTGSKIADGELILTGLTLDQSPYVLAMVMGAAVISLLLDRRSLLVGCLLPTVGIFNGFAGGEMAAVAGLLLAGTALIFFSTAWTRLRSGLLALLPSRLAAQLPRTNLIALGQRPTRQHKEMWRLR
jgi:hypothetical protein